MSRACQRIAHIGQQAQGIVHGATVLLQTDGGPTFGTPEKPPDQSVEQADDLVGQALRCVEHAHYQRCAPTQRRQRPEVLSSQRRALLRQPADPFFMDPGQHGRIDADRPRRPTPLDQTDQRLGVGAASDVAHPGQGLTPCSEGTSVSPSSARIRVSDMPAVSIRAT